MKKNTFLLTLVASLISIQCAFSAPSAKETTQALLENTINQAVSILQQTDTSDAQKIKAFETLLSESCHTELMAMLALGKNGRARLPKEQVGEFVSAFVHTVTLSYYSKLNMAEAATVNIEYLENKEVSATKRVLSTVIKGDSSDFNVNYKLAVRKGAWGIYDMDIEGISLLATYKSQFSDFLKTGSPQDLIKRLQKD